MKNKFVSIDNIINDLEDFKLPEPIQTKNNNFLYHFSNKKKGVLTNTELYNRFFCFKCILC